MTPSRYFQPHVAHMAGYIPGEQPRGTSLIKLNTNENPYPPSPRVLGAIQAAANDHLRLYPDPMATDLREAAAELHGLDPAWILAGNGSDDLLTIVTRAFLTPGSAAVYPTPSYLLYRSLVEIQNGRAVEVPYGPDWSLDAATFATESASTAARLAFLANPNSPSGTALSPDEVADIARRLECPLVVDEAYADFAEWNCAHLVTEHPNVIIVRTLSKGYSLAGLRMGYLVASPEIINGLIKVKDSYNCDRLSIVGGAAALRDQEYLASTQAKIRTTRGRLLSSMRRLGYLVPESQANFAWCVGGPPASEVYDALRARGILVRLMRYAGHEPALRITVGSDTEINMLVEALDRIVGR